MDDLLRQPPDCVREPDSWCSQVYHVTKSNWLAASAEWMVAKPLHILLILAIAIIVRWLIRRAIDRMAEGRVPRVVRKVQSRRETAAPALPSSSERRRQRARTVASVLKSITSFVVFGIASVMILGELGINLTPILASAGVLGVAIGFGAQNLVRDFLSGLFMMAEDQYGVGDVVDIGEASGTVEAVGLRVTTLRDVNGTVWYVRNGEVLRVGNSSQGFAVAVVDVPVGYDADIDEALDIVGKTLDAAVESEPLSDDVLASPELLGIESVTAEAVTIRCTVKVRPGRQWAVQRKLRARIVDALNEAGIKPPLGRFGA